MVRTYDQLKEAVLIHKNFVEVSEDLYFDALTCVPPNYLINGAFQLGEEYSDNLFYTFGEKDGKYFGCLCNANFSINNF
jgi:hypothetical protein